jgi:hypothetical protein
MATASIALSQSIQNAHYVNTLTQNVTYALQQQVSIDEKIDVRLNTLETALLARTTNHKIQTGPPMSCGLPAHLYPCCSLQ